MPAGSLHSLGESTSSLRRNPAQMDTTQADIDAGQSNVLIFFAALTAGRLVTIPPKLICPDHADCDMANRPDRKPCAEKKGAARCPAQFQSKPAGDGRITDVLENPPGAKVRPIDSTWMKAKARVPTPPRGEQPERLAADEAGYGPNCIAVPIDETEDRARRPRNPGMSDQYIKREDHHGTVAISTNGPLSAARTTGPPEPS